MNHIGFNITKDKLQVVEVIKSSEIYYLKNADEERFSENLDFISDDFDEILQDAFNNLNSRSKTKSKFVSISLPLEMFKLFFFPDQNEFSHEELKQHIELEFSILYPTITFQDYIIRTKKISKGISSYPEILVIGIENQFLHKLHDFLLKNNFILQFIDMSHFSSDLLIQKNSAVSIYFSEEFISSSIYMNNDMIGFRKSNIDQASRHIDYLSNLHTREDLTLDQFYISGDVDVNSIKQKIEEVLQIKINTINPFDLLETAESFTNTEHYLDNPRLFNAAAGICFRLQ